MELPQRFCVRWNSYKTNLQTAFPKLLTSEHFVDVTLACEKQYLKCHKVVLSACSVYFEDLLVNNPCPHPIIFMKDVAFWEMKALVEFMYKGEVSVSQEQLDSLLKSAESLQIRGLSGAKRWMDDPEVEPKKRKKEVVNEEEEKSLQITTLGQPDELDDVDVLEQASVTDEKSSLELKEEPMLEMDDSAYLDNTDDDGPGFGSDEVYPDSSREAGPSGIADLTSLALNSVECVMDAQERVKDEHQGKMADHNYTNSSCVEDIEEDSRVGIHMLSTATTTVMSGLPGAASFRTIAPKPAIGFAVSVPCPPILSPKQCQQQQQPPPQQQQAIHQQAVDTRPRAIRKDAFNRIRRSEAELGKAAEMVRGGMTFQTASDTFNIPISTIRFYMARRGILPQRRRGRGSSGQRDDDLMHPPFEIVHYRLPDIDKPV